MKRVPVRRASTHSIGMMIVGIVVTSSASHGCGSTIMRHGRCSEVLLVMVLVVRHDTRSARGLVRGSRKTMARLTIVGVMRRHSLRGHHVACTSTAALADEVGVTALGVLCGAGDVCCDTLHGGWLVSRLVCKPSGSVSPFLDDAAD